MTSGGPIQFSALGTALEVAALAILLIVALVAHTTESTPPESER